MNSIRIKILLLAIVLIPSAIAQEKFQTKSRAKKLRIYRQQSKLLKPQKRFFTLSLSSVLFSFF